MVGVEDRGAPEDRPDHGKLFFSRRAASRRPYLASRPMPGDWPMESRAEGIAGRETPAITRVPYRGTSGSEPSARRPLQGQGQPVRHREQGDAHALIGVYERIETPDRVRGRVPDRRVRHLTRP